MGCCGGGLFSRNQNQQSQVPVQSRVDTPIEALKTRLARGEISIDEYQKLMSVLQQDEFIRR